MQIYEINNPSDFATLKADDAKVGQAACLVLGQGKYGLTRVSTGETVLPVLLFGEFPGELGLRDFVNAHKTEIVACLRSVLLGHDRQTLEEAMALVTPEQAKQLLTSYHDRHRTSLNDICARAWKIAEAFDKQKS